MLLFLLWFYISSYLTNFGNLPLVFKLVLKDMFSFFREMASLSAVDYVIFTLMLVVCGAIGIYHAIRSKHQQTTSNYLLADQSMNKFPIAVSLLVSFLSAVAILGIPSEVYTYGLSYILVSVAFTILLLMSAFLYVPVFYKLKITSTNEVMNFNARKNLQSAVQS